MPAISAGQYLIEAMQKLGPVRSNGMGLGPTDWDIIHPFALATGRLVEGWEMETLADMCVGYHAELQAGENPFALSPMEQDQLNE